MAGIEVMARDGVDSMGVEVELSRTVEEGSQSPRDKQPNNPNSHSETNSETMNSRPAKKLKPNKDKKARRSVVDKVPPEIVAANNKKYAEKYPNWTTPLSEHPLTRRQQAIFDAELNSDGDELEAERVTVATIENRRVSPVEQGKALEVLLTQESVELLIEKGVLTAQVAREWGAYVQAAGGTVPFNLVHYGLENFAKAKDRDGNLINPPRPPAVGSDKDVILGLLFPSWDSLLHYKSWYNRIPGADFEKDLIYPILDAFRLYLKDHPNVRQYPLGMKSTKKGSRAPTSRDIQSATLKHPGRYYTKEYKMPDVEISHPDDVISLDSDDEDSEGEPRVFTTKSGARLFMVNNDTKQAAAKKEELKNVHFEFSGGQSSPGVDLDTAGLAAGAETPPVVGTETEGQALNPDDPVQELANDILAKEKAKEKASTEKASTPFAQMPPADPITQILESPDPEKQVKQLLALFASVKGLTPETKQTAPSEDVEGDSKKPAVEKDGPGKA